MRACVWTDGLAGVAGEDLGGLGGAGAVAEGADLAAHDGDVEVEARVEADHRDLTPIASTVDYYFDSRRCKILC